MKTQKPEATAADEILKNLDLPPVPQRFPTKLMRKQGELLGRADDLLSHAYATANSVAVIADVVRRSQIAREMDDEVLTSREEDHLLAAVTLLAEQLSETLCYAADRLDDELSKGGGVMSRRVIECNDHLKHFVRKDRKFKALKAKKLEKYPFAALPFVNRKLAEHRMQPEHWDVDLGGGYKVGEAMALAYLKCDRAHGRQHMHYFLTRIVMSFFIRYEQEGGYQALREQEGNDGAAALCGQIVGFFNTISDRLTLASRFLFHDLDTVTEQELIDIANIGMKFDHVAYMASLKD